MWAARRGRGARCERQAPTPALPRPPRRRALPRAARRRIRSRARAEREGSGDSTWHTSCGRAAPRRSIPAGASPFKRLRLAAPGSLVRPLFFVIGIISVVGALANSFFLPATVGGRRTLAHDVSVLHDEVNAPQILGVCERVGRHRDQIGGGAHGDM